MIKINQVVLTRMKNCSVYHKTRTYVKNNRRYLKTDCIGVFHGMAPMARALAELVEKSLKWETVKDLDPTL